MSSIYLIPRYLFDSPHSLRHGIMTWLDLWSPYLGHTILVSDKRLYPMLGVNRVGFWVSGSVCGTRSFLTPEVMVGCTRCGADSVPRKCDEGSFTAFKRTGCWP